MTSSDAAPLAVVLLVHDHPQRVRRLVRALSPAPVILHCDAKTPPEVFAAMCQGLDDRVRATDRLDARLASWSLVKAELSALRIAVRETSSRHIAVLSGADYPLASMERIFAVLEAWRGRSWYWNQPVPWEPWGVPGFRDGGLWRFRLPFITRNDQMTFVFGKPAFLPGRRRIPADLALRASNHWKIYSRADAEAVLHIVDTRPDLVAFGRRMFTPEESFLPGLLGSEALRGDAAVGVSGVDPWLISWPDTPSTHPQWLDAADFDLVAGRASGRAATPEAVDRCDSPLSQEFAPLFGRKFRDPEMLDRIDAELRV